ncbi:phytanoyl-CoA dioxygenase family protein [Xylariomycetidae sp. FL0641]|nr:phytanoyl-CoA dioxygenase family protein [Xylariomycetidae sp. FL0641]
MAPTATNGATTTTTSHAEALATHGYTIARNLLSPSDLSTLREAAARTTAQARSGHWPHVRTVGKQFPPWPATSPSSPQPIWGVQGLLDPALPDAAVFARSYFSDAVVDVVKDILELAGDGDEGEEKLVMELYNLLVDPPTPFALRWHRDDVPADATPAQEAQRLGLTTGPDRPGETQPLAARTPPAYHAQWNLALYPDASLVVVPGSHARVRTATERGADPSAPPALPGQLVVHLDPGDAVFYDNNILHRGVYAAGAPRASLHGSVGHVDAGARRARNVLQHGVGAWVDRCEFAALGDERLRRRAEGMRARLLDLGRRAGGDVGFSLTG